MGKIEIFKSVRDRNFYFRVKARNNEIIAQSEGYLTKQGARTGIRSLIKNLLFSKIVEL